LKSRILSSKKGIGEEIIAVLVFIFTAVLVVVLIKANSEVDKGKSQEEIISDSEFAEGQQALLNYLGSLDASGKTEAEIIKEAYEKNDYTFVKADAKSFFDRKLGHIEGWRFVIREPPQSEIAPGDGVFEIAGNNYAGSAQQLLKGTAYVPVNEKYVVVELWYGKYKASEQRESKK